MGGVWTPPLKLVDGVWFGLDDQWVGPATKFSSGWGYTRYDLPDTAGLEVERTDFVPDGRRGVLFGLEITNPGAARTAKLSVDAHSELMGQYPWGFTGRHSQRQRQPRRRGQLRRPAPGVHRRRRAARRAGAPLRGAGGHRADSPTRASIGDQFWGPQPGHRCTGTEPGAPAEPKPSQCDDGPFGRGTGGQLTYTLSPPGRRLDRPCGWRSPARTRALAPAQEELAELLRRPRRRSSPRRSPLASSSRR